MAQYPQLGLADSTLAQFLTPYEVPIIRGGLTKASFNRLPRNKIFVLLNKSHWFAALRTNANKLLVFDSLGQPRTALNVELTVPFQNWNKYGYQGMGSPVCGYYVLAVVMGVIHGGLQHGDIDSLLNFLPFRMPIPKTMPVWYSAHVKYKDNFEANDQAIYRYIIGLYPSIAAVDNPVEMPKQSTKGAPIYIGGPGYRAVARRHLRKGSDDDSDDDDDNNGRRARSLIKRHSAQIAQIREPTPLPPNPGPSAPDAEVIDHAEDMKERLLNLENANKDIGQLLIESMEETAALVAEKGQILDDLEQAHTLSEQRMAAVKLSANNHEQQLVDAHTQQLKIMTDRLRIQQNEIESLESVRREESTHENNEMRQLRGSYLDLQTKFRELDSQYTNQLRQLDDLRQQLEEAREHPTPPQAEPQPPGTEESDVQAATIEFLTEEVQRVNERLHSVDEERLRVSIELERVSGERSVVDSLAAQLASSSASFNEANERHQAYQERLKELHKSYRDAMQALMKSRKDFEELSTSIQGPYPTLYRTPVMHTIQEKVKEIAGMTPQTYRRIMDIFQELVSRGAAAAQGNAHVTDAERQQAQYRVLAALGEDPNLVDRDDLRLVSEELAALANRAIREYRPPTPPPQAPVVLPPPPAAPPIEAYDINPMNAMAHMLHEREGDNEAAAPAAPGGIFRGILNSMTSYLAPASTARQNFDRQLDAGHRDSYIRERVNREINDRRNTALWATASIADQAYTRDLLARHYGEEYDRTQGPRRLRDREQVRNRVTRARDEAAARTGARPRNNPYARRPEMDSSDEEFDARRQERDNLAATARALEQLHPLHPIGIDDQGRAIATAPMNNQRRGLPEPELTDDEEEWTDA